MFSRRPPFTPTKAEPIVLPLWVMYLVYILHGLFGWMVVITDSIGQTEPESIVGALGGYGMAIGVVSTLALVSAIFFRRCHWVEMLFAAALFALMSTYIVAAIEPLFMGDLDAVRRMSIVLLSSLLPLFRTIELGNNILGSRARRER